MVFFRTSTRTVKRRTLPSSRNRSVRSSEGSPGDRSLLETGGTDHRGPNTTCISDLNFLRITSPVGVLGDRSRVYYRRLTREDEVPGVLGKQNNDDVTEGWLEVPSRTGDGTYRSEGVSNTQTLTRDRRRG